MQAGSAWRQLRPPSPGSCSMPLHMTTIIGTAVPAAISLSRMKFTCPCIVQQVSFSP